MNTKTQNTQTTTTETIFNVIYLLSLPTAIVLYFINI